MINIETVKTYCCDDISLIENYQQAVCDSQTWHCHHRLETDLDLGRDELIQRGLYWKRPASELIFLTPKEHMSLHTKGKPSPNKGKHHTEESKRKISLSNKGKTLTKETKRKMSLSRKGKPSPNKGKHHTEESKRKMSLSNKGKTKQTLRWLTPDGKIVYMAKCNAICHHPDWKLAAQTDSIALF